MIPQPLDRLRNLADRLPDGDQRTDPDALHGAFVEWAGDQGFELYPAQQEALLELVTGSHVILVNAERTFTPYCRLNLDPLGALSLATWSSWVPPRVAARCGVRGCGRSPRPGG